jgi:hypothetical protein
MSGFEIAAATALIAGAGASAAGTISAGRQEQANLQSQAGLIQQRAQANQEAAEFEAQQLDIQANQERAAAQLEALQDRRNQRLALSKLQANAAFSGFDATSPDVLAEADRIAQFGEQQAQTAQFTGDSRAEQLRLVGDAKRFSGTTGIAAAQREAEALFASGRSARTGSFLSAAGTILGAAGSLGGKFAKRPIKPSPTVTEEAFRKFG